MMEFTGEGLSDDLEVLAARITSRMLGWPLRTASPPPVPLHPVAAKATVPAEPVRNTRRANMVLVL